MSQQIPQTKNETDLPVRGRRVPIKEFLNNCGKYGIHSGKLTEGDPIDFIEDDTRQQTAIHSTPTDSSVEYNGKEDLHEHEFMEPQVNEDYSSNRNMSFKSGSEGNSEKNQSFNPNELANRNITSSTAPQNRTLLLVDKKRKSYTYKNRFGKEILMSKHRPNAEYNENSGILVNNSMGAREIEEILAFLDEPSADKKDNTKNKGKKRKTKGVSEKIVVEKTEATRPEESLAIDEDVRIVETDLMMVKTTEETDLYETALQEAEFNSNIISKESVSRQVPERIESISSPFQNNTKMFFTRADSFPTLNEANMRDDYVDGKHRRSPQIKPKTDGLFNKKSTHDSGVNSPVDDSNKLMDESFTSKVIIVDEDPLTPIDDITKSYGISFFYDQGLEHRDRDEKKKGEKSEQGEKSTKIVSDSGVKTYHAIATNDLPKQELLNIISSLRIPIIQKASIKTLFSNVSKETNDLYQRMVNAWDTFQNRGAKPYIYECGKAF